MVVFAAECEAGSMHISPDYGIGENDEPVPPGWVGQLICTSLVNWIQPFIRYRLGDMGSLKEGPCACGSSLPMIGVIEGRTDAVLITQDGRRIGRLDPTFKDTKGIGEAQVVQDDLVSFRIRLVPSSTYTEADGRKMIANLSQRVGKADIRIGVVDKIERTAAAMFKAVVRDIPRDRPNQRLGRGRCCHSERRERYKLR